MNLVAAVFLQCMKKPSILKVRKISDVIFVVANALDHRGVVQVGFRTAAEAEKFIEDFYLARRILRPRESKNEGRVRSHGIGASYEEGRHRAPWGRHRRPARAA